MGLQSQACDQIARRQSRLGRRVGIAQGSDWARRRCGTKPRGLLKTQLSIRTDNSDITRPGFLEADMVAICWRVSSATVNMPPVPQAQS